MENKQKENFGKDGINHWSSEFFISELSLSKKSVIVKEEVKNDVENKYKNINKYVLQLGKFKIVEKHLFFNEEIFIEIYDKSYGNILKKLMKSNKNLLNFDELKHHFESQTMRELLIKVIIFDKRGVFVQNSKIFKFIDKYLSKITFNCLPYVYGESIHADEGDIADINSVWKEEKLDNVKVCGLDFSKINTNFFSLSNRVIPEWINVRQKSGVMIINGVAPNEVENRNFQLMVLDPTKKIIFQFWLTVHLNENSLDKHMCQCINMTNNLGKRKECISNKDREYEFRVKYKLNQPDKSQKTQTIQMKTFVTSLENEKNKIDKNGETISTLSNFLSPTQH